MRLNFDPSRNASAAYQRCRTIGSGSFGVVFHVSSVTTGQDRAMKVIKKAPSEIPFLKNEIEAMMRLDHPNVVRFHEFFEEHGSVSVVTEFCTGGDFTALLGGKCSSDELRVLFRDVVAGVSYCHRLGVAHRDLKLQNCLLAEGMHRRVGKVIDFGLSSIRRQEGPAGDGDAWMGSAQGTLPYTAPEVLSRARYGLKCDAWSLGVMLYYLLTNEHPFLANFQLGSTGLIKSVLHGQVRLEPLDAQKVDYHAQDLVFKLLAKQPLDRLGAGGALREKWLSGTIGQCGTKIGLSMRTLWRRLRAFGQLPQFAKAALMFLGQQATVAEAEESRESFLSLDKDGDGHISCEELADAMHLSWCPNKVEDVVKTIDLDGDGRVSWAEWLSATLPLQQRLRSVSVQRALFNFFDVDGNGAISSSELTRIVGREEAERVLSWSGGESLPWESFRVLVGHIEDDSDGEARPNLVPPSDCQPRVSRGATQPNLDHEDRPQPRIRRHITCSGGRCTFDRNLRGRARAPMV